MKPSGGTSGIANQTVKSLKHMALKWNPHGSRQSRRLRMRRMSENILPERDISLYLVKSTSQRLPLFRFCAFCSTFVHNCCNFTKLRAAKTQRALTARLFKRKYQVTGARVACVTAIWALKPSPSGVWLRMCVRVTCKSPLCRFLQRAETRPPLRETKETQRKDDRTLFTDYTGGWKIKFPCCCVCGRRSESSG